MVNIILKSESIETTTTGLIVHGVNCLHSMQSGVAAILRAKWPIIYEKYMGMPKGKEMLGKTHIICITHDLYIANCYTQVNYGYDGIQYACKDAIKQCLTSCYEFAKWQNMELNSVKIGCGLGGLSWEDEVHPIFISLNSEYNVPTYIYYVDKEN